MLRLSAGKRQACSNIASKPKKTPLPLREALHLINRPRLRNQKPIRGARQTSARRRDFWTIVSATWRARAARLAASDKRRSR